jgi:AraC-like DNA-binding protein
MPAGLRWVTIAAPALLFADVAPAPGGFGPHPRELPIPPRIRSEIRGLLREVDAWGEDGTQAAGIEIEDRSAAGWARVLAWALAGARQPPAAGTGAQRAALAVASAEDFFLERLASTVYLRDVSAAVGVPARTLEAAFRRVLGVTPMGYLEILRAHAVLRALRSPDPLAPCSVHAAERSAGVTHGPRFAARFRALFGEGPAATLAATRQVEAPSDAQVPATP